MQNHRCAVEQKGTNLRYVPISMTSTRRGLSPSSCTPSLWKGPPEPLWSAPLHRSLELSNFALMFATGRGSWMPARLVTADPQGAVPRGTGPREQCMPLAHASSIPKQPLLAARAEGAQVTAPQQQDLGSQGQRLGTCQVAITSLVAATGNPSSGSPGVAGTCGLKISQNQRALPLTEMLGPPQSQVGLWEWHLVPTHFLPWCTQSLLWTPDLMAESQDTSFF